MTDSRLEFVATVALALVMTTLSAAQARPKAKEFDLDDSGRLDTVEELRRFLLHAENRPLRAADSNKDGALSQPEINAYLNTSRKALTDPFKPDAREERLSRANALLQRIHAGRYASDLQLEDDVLGPAFERQPLPFSVGNLLLRRSYTASYEFKDELLARTRARNKDGSPTPDAIAARNQLLNDLRNAEAAQFSFSRDLETNSTAWAARGALLFPINLLEPESSEPEDQDVGRWAIVPSISFDRVSDDANPANELDNLIFRLALDREESTFFGSHRWTLNLTFATDFDGDSEVWGGEGSWDPSIRILPGIALGTPQRVCDALSWRLRARAQFEAGQVEDAGNKADLRTTDDFFRVGPSVEAALLGQPDSLLERWTLRTSYRSFFGLSGEPDHAELLESTLRYQLDELGQVTVEANYQNGDVPFTAEASELFTLTLGVKF